MKKANINNFLILLISYILPIGFKEFVEIDRIQIQMDVIYKLFILVGMYLFLIFYVFNLSKNVFNLFIKHKQSVKLINSRIYVFIVGFLTAFAFIYFNIEYYFYFSSILLLYCLYFIFLYLLGNKYIKTSKENKIEINDELVDDFLILLGGKENIMNVTYEYSRLKVELKNIKIVELEKIKNLGAQGLFVAGNKLQAIVGNNASDLENAIKRYLTKV